MLNLQLSYCYLTETRLATISSCLTQLAFYRFFGSIISSIAFLWCFSYTWTRMTFWTNGLKQPVVSLKGWNQTSADKDSESLDSSVSSLSNRTGENWDRQNLDRQIPDRKSGQNPDSRQTPDTIFRIIRTKPRQGQDTDRAVRRRLGHIPLLST